jgi:glutathione peroxidase
MRALFAKLASVVLLAVFPSSVRAAPDQTGSAFDFSFEAIDGKPMPLSQYKGKALLVVNTASFCGFTRQYEGLQALWQKYQEQGLVVIGVPSNDFGEQEPNGESEIKEFCQGAFGVTFPLTSKCVVKGDGAHPFYQWARDAMGGNSAPGWNFHKYLVGRDGKLVAAFPSQVTPDHADLIGAIERELAAK